MTMKSLRYALFTVCTLLIAAAALVPGSGQTAPDAYFMPGAKVFLEFSVEAPPNWDLNSEVPLRLSFDEEGLKKQSYTVKQAVWDFKLNPHSTTYTAEIPVFLSKQAAPGKLDIPVVVACSICDAGAGQCTFINETVNVGINIEAKGSPNKPQSKGKRAWKHLLTAP
jgi:hypothetical protein